MTNVIFIIIDALRARNLGCYGYDKATSPNIDWLAKNGIMFKNCFSCTNATDSSLTSIFSGKFPHSHGIYRHGTHVTRKEVKILNNTKTVFLPEVLRSNGYKTLGLGYHGRWHKRGYSYYLRDEIGERTRIQKHVERLPESVKSKLRSLYHLYNYEIKKEDYHKTREVTNKALRLINQHKNTKFFLFIHYLSTHLPYRPPKKYSKNFQREKGQKLEEVVKELKNAPWGCNLEDWFRKIVNVDYVEEVIANYDGEIAFVDEQIGRIKERLEELSIIDDTLFVITSDHGESLTEHGIYFDHHGLYDVSLHVPLIFWHPELSSKKASEMIQHVDIFPTLLDFLKISKEEYKRDIDGINLLDNVENKDGRDFVFAIESYAQEKAAIRIHRYKFIYSIDSEGYCRYCNKVHGGEKELYDLKKDPEETENIINEMPELAKNLEEILLKWEKKLKKRREKKIIRKKMESGVQ